MPKVSVIMPVYNESLYIKEAIDSITQQTFEDFELLIFDDQSTDNTVDIISSVEDERIRLYRLPFKSNLPIIKNYGLSEARGEYIAFMDGDDLSPPRRFELEVQCLDRHPEVGVVSGRHRNFGHSTHEFMPPYDSPRIKQELIFHTTLCHGGSMLRKAVLDESGIRFRPEYHVCEDYALWVDLVPYTEFHNLDDLVLHIRISDQNITGLSQSGQHRRRHRKFILDEIHRQAFQVNGIDMSEEELTVFNNFVGDTRIEVQTRAAVDTLECLFDRLLLKVKAKPELDYDCFAEQCRKRLARYRERQIE